MAGPLDIDPLDPLDPITPVDPWSWVPSSWSEQAAGAAPMPTVTEPVPVPVPVEAMGPEGPQTQPGLALPTSTVDASTALPPMPDAISGVDAVAPLMPDAPPVEDALAPLPFAEPQRDVLLDATDPAQLVDLAHRDPVEYAAQGILADQRRTDEFTARDQALRTQDAARAEAEFQELQQINRRAEEKAAEIENESLDPNGYVRKMSPFQFIATLVSVVVGGLHAATPAGRGRNIGLEMLEADIARDFEAQKLNQAKRQNAVQEMRARGWSEFQQRQAHRLAGYAAARDALRTEMQNYDPAGTTARRIAGEALRIESAMAQSAEAVRKQTIDDEIKGFKLRAELREADDKHAESLLKQQAASKKLAGGDGSAKRDPSYFANLGLRPPPMPMTDKEYDAWQRRAKNDKDLGGNNAQARKQEADAQKAEAEAKAASRGFAIANPETGESLVQKDGTPFVQMDAEERKRLRGITTAAANIRKLADRMRALKQNYGGALTSLGTKEAQELKSLASMIDFETFKAFDLGAPSEGDKALAEGVRGGVDPTSFVRDATEGFEAYADAVEKKALGHLRGAGYTGGPLKFRRAADLAPSAPSVADEMAKRIAGADYEPDPDAPALQFVLPGEQQQHKEVDEAFQILGAYAEQPGDRGIGARAHLRELAAKAISPAARAKAKAILDALPGANVRSEGAR